MINKERFLVTQNLKGQILVIILLGTSIALTVALSVSLRTISTIRQTTLSARSQAALAAAESGAEIALARLKNGECLTSGSCVNVEGTISESQTNYSYTVSIGGGSSDPYLIDLPRDQTLEIKLTDPSQASWVDYQGTSVDFCWYDESLEGSPEKENAVEIIVYDGNMSLVPLKYVYLGADPPGGPDLGATGFLPVGVGRSVVVSGKTISFNHCQRIPESPKDFTSPKFLLRVKTLYNNLSGVVIPEIGKSLPPQSYVVESLGTTSDKSISKKIRVIKSLPSAPGIFDFIIYNGSETEPLAK